MPPQSEEELVSFLSTVDDFLTEAQKASRFVMSNKEAARRFLGLETTLRETSHPECAEPLYRALKEAFLNEAKAYAALARRSNQFVLYQARV